MFQNYGGSAPRSFNFSFDLIPNNSEEAYSIMNIILNLKKFSLPRSIVGGVSLLAPFIFEIEIGNENMRKLINMNDVVLTEIGVNYGADGNMQMFSNGIPKFILESKKEEGIKPHLIVINRNTTGDELKNKFVELIKTFKLHQCDKNIKNGFKIIRNNKFRTGN